MRQITDATGHQISKLYNFLIVNRRQIIFGHKINIITNFEKHILLAQYVGWFAFYQQK